jgi:hypothetical protein
VRAQLPRAWASKNLNPGPRPDFGPGLAYYKAFASKSTKIWRYSPVSTGHDSDVSARRVDPPAACQCKFELRYSFDISMSVFPR